MNTWLPIIGPILALVSAIAVAAIVARRGRQADKIVEQAGIATDKTNSIGQVMAALNSLNDSLQEDNGVLRGQIALVRAEVEAIRLRLDIVETGNLELVRKNLELERENRILHAEAEASAKKIAKLEARIEELERGNGPLGS